MKLVIFMIALYWISASWADDYAAECTFHTDEDNIVEAGDLDSKPYQEQLARALVGASTNGDVAAILQLLKQGANVNAESDALEMPPLIWAVRCGHLDAVDLLVKHGADVNQEASYQTSPGWHHSKSTALIWASGNNDKKMVEYLLNHGANAKTQEWSFKEKINETDVGEEFILSSSRDALYAARDYEVIELLLKFGANPNATTQVTPLMNAAAEGNIKLVSLLLRYGADKTRKNREGKTAFDIAVQTHPDDKELAKLLSLK